MCHLIFLYCAGARREWIDACTLNKRTPDLNENHANLDIGIDSGFGI
jgi:hypothetical protein